MKVPCLAPEPLATPPQRDGPASPDNPDWNNLKVLNRNRLPTRTAFVAFPDDKTAREAAENPQRFEHSVSEGHDSSLRQLLSGPGASAWKFDLSKSPLAGPTEFHAVDHDTSSWPDIQVPGMWQLQGFGKGPQYTNIDFPFAVAIPRVPVDDNECGRYVHVFDVQQRLVREDATVRLRFEGVDSAYSVWLNGKYVGYSQGSRNPAEFDVSDLVDFKGPNTLTVEVYQRCDGTYIEDQDMWWLSGIFRDVSLLVWPKEHVVNIAIETLLDQNYKAGTAKLAVDFSRQSNVEITLLDPFSEVIHNHHTTVGEHQTWELALTDPIKWTAETPVLYTVVLKMEHLSVAQRIGFRQVDIIDGVFRVNGDPVKFCGVNRHDHHPQHGRAVPYTWMRHDLVLMKTHNINAVRTSHYPNDPRLYDVADELGLWVFDEADLECHGVEQISGQEHAREHTTDNPDWEEAYLDRARQLVLRDRNHASIVVWSLGNESFYGRNHQAMYRWIKEADPTRPIHYQPDHEAVTADMFGEFYPDVSWVDKRGAEKRAKPTVLSEYSHAMGNGPGNMAEYAQVLYKHPTLMGGFIWEWANHGLATTDAEGLPYMGYGGDFDDDPNDSNFVMDGLCFSNHTPTPGLTEFAKVFEPVQTIGFDGTVVTIINRYDFLTLDHLECIGRVACAEPDGSIGEFTIPLPQGIMPHTTADVTVILPSTTRAEAYLQLSFRLKNATAWAPAKFQVATGEVPLSSPGPLRAMAPPANGQAVVLAASATEVIIKSATGASTWTFDLVSGVLSGWRKPLTGQLLASSLALDFFRALTDNDRGSFGRDWLERRLHQAQHHPSKITKTITANGVEIVVIGRYAPPVYGWAIDTITTYIFEGDRMRIRIKGTPSGTGAPETLARIGFILWVRGVEGARWWGRGPGEAYRDKKHSQLFGRWQGRVDDLWVDYEYPQEGGNRTDVRWVDVLGPDEQSFLRASFGPLKNASFALHRVSGQELEKAKHPEDVRHAARSRAKKDGGVCVRLDWAHMGIGTGSCGPGTLEQYRIKASDSFEYEILLE